MSFTLTPRQELLYEYRCRIWRMRTEDFVSDANGAILSHGGWTPVFSDVPLLLNLGVPMTTPSGTGRTDYDISMTFDSLCVPGDCDVNDSDIVEVTGNVNNAADEKIGMFWRVQGEPQMLGYNGCRRPFFRHKVTCARMQKAPDDLLAAREELVRAQEEEEA